VTKPPSGQSALAGALMWGRERFNARFEFTTKILRKPIDPEEFSIHLMENVGPVAEAVARVDPARVNSVVETLYELSLDLMGGGFLGLQSRYKWPEKVFFELFPVVATLLGQDPRLVAGSLLNAAITLEGEPTARPQEWVEKMKTAAAIAKTPKQLLDAGMALSWRCGMAHFRPGALKVVEDLPEPLALALFAEENAGSKSQLAARLARIWPEKGDDEQSRKQTQKPVALIGGFTGFGGPFTAPADLFLREGQIHAMDDTAEFSVHADRFGAVIKKIGPAPSRGPKPGMDKELEKVAKSAFPGVTGGGGQTRSWAYDGATLAVSLKVSHKIFLFALRRPAG